MNIIKPFDEEIEKIKNLKNIIFNTNDMRFPSNFDLSHPQSLSWFVIILRLKWKWYISKLSYHLMMNERKQFSENQLNDYMIPQISLIEDKIKNFIKYWPIKKTWSNIEKTEIKSRKNWNIQIMKENIY